MLELQAHDKTRLVHRVDQQGGPLRTKIWLLQFGINTQVIIQNRAVRYPQTISR